MPVANISTYLEGISVGLEHVDDVINDLKLTLADLVFVNDMPHAA